MPSAQAVSDLVENRSLIPREQHRPDIVEKRRNFGIARRFVPPDPLVFLDESSAKTNMTRLYGQASIGDRCNFAHAHGHWKTTTLISALRVDGVVESATQLIDGPMNAATFVGYVERCLAPSLRAGDGNWSSNSGDGWRSAPGGQPRPTTRGASPTERSAPSTTVTSRGTRSLESQAQTRQRGNAQATRTRSFQSSGQRERPSGGSRSRSAGRRGR